MRLPTRLVAVWGVAAFGVGTALADPPDLSGAWSRSGGGAASGSGEQAGSEQSRTPAPVLEIAQSGEEITVTTGGRRRFSITFLTDGSSQPLMIGKRSLPVAISAAWHDDALVVQISGQARGRGRGNRPFAPGITSTWTMPDQDTLRIEMQRGEQGGGRMLELTRQQPSSAEE